MNDSISSAGLVYVYLNGYEEDGFLSIQTTDTYRYMEDAFYRQVMEKTAVADQDDDMVHIFAVVGANDKATMVYRLLEDELRENFQRILEEKTIRKFLQELDKTGNTFFQCVQEFFVIRLGIFRNGFFVITESSCLLEYAAAAYRKKLEIQLLRELCHYGWSVRNRVCAGGS